MNIHVVETMEDFPEWIDYMGLTEFLYNSLKPFEDPIEEVAAGIKKALTPEDINTGFVVIAEIDKKPVGSVVMLTTGMKGFVPENLLLYIAVDPGARRKGVGQKMFETVLKHTEGDIKLHVEHDNPAIKFYERMGMTSKYREMRYNK